jgi:hypothetical protein
MLLFKSIYWALMTLLGLWLLWLEWKDRLDIPGGSGGLIFYPFLAVLLYYVILRFVKIFKGDGGELGTQLDETEATLLGMVTEGNEEDGLTQLNLNKPEKQPD